MVDLKGLSIDGPLLYKGDAFALLKEVPDGSIDLIVTSPPYYSQRDIPEGPFKEADNATTYLRLLKRLGKEFKRILRPTGSLWLNIGDAYKDQSLLLIPSRVAIAFEDELRLTLREDIIWEKRKFLSPSLKNRTSNSYEHFFHFVLGKNYYANKTVGLRDTQRVDEKGRVISRTGVTGEDYKRKIENSLLSENQKKEAVSALNLEISKVKNHEISDFRMLLNGGSSILHAQRKEELQKKGFAFIEAGMEERVGDVWSVGLSAEKEHDSPFPEELVAYPILRYCPKDGIILDPFAGSGTTLVAAKHLRRKAFGFEIREDYAALAKKRIEETK